MNIQEIRDRAPNEANCYFIDEDCNVFYYLYCDVKKTLMHFNSRNDLVFCHDPQIQFNIDSYRNIKPLY